MIGGPAGPGDPMPTLMTAGPYRFFIVMARGALSSPASRAPAASRIVAGGEPPAVGSTERETADRKAAGGVVTEKLARVWQRIGP